MGSPNCKLGSTTIVKKRRQGSTKFIKQESKQILLFLLVFWTSTLQLSSKSAEDLFESFTTHEVERGKGRPKERDVNRTYILAGSPPAPSVQLVHPPTHPQSFPTLPQSRVTSQISLYRLEHCHHLPCPGLLRAPPQRCYLR